MLDTSVAIPLRDGDERCADRLSGKDQLLLSAISLAELEGGVYRDPAQSDRKRDRLETMLKAIEILSFDEEAARMYGSIVASLGFSRGRIIDRMIAAQAIRADAILLTLNGRDFRDILGLSYEDWSS